MYNDTASNIGTTNGESVQVALDARLKASDLASSQNGKGAELVGLAQGGTLQDAIRFFPVASSLAGTGVDIAPDINAAIAAAAAAGGGDVLLPAGILTIAATIDNPYANVRLIGSGHDSSHGAGTNLLEKTLIKWAGAVGGTMMRIRTPYGPSTQRRVGQGVRRLEMSGESIAAHGLELDSIFGGTFEDLHVKHCTVTQYNLKTGNTGVDSPAGEALDLQGCRFARTTFDTRTAAYGASPAKGWLLAGSSNANVSGNVFEGLTGIYTNGAAFSLVQSDNNVFIRCSAFRADGDAEAYTWDLSGATGASLGSYGNTFIQVGWDSHFGFRFQASLVDDEPIRTNLILGYDEANGAQPPVVGGNSRLVCTSSVGAMTGYSRLALQQTAANPNNGITLSESANRFDMWLSGNTLNMAANGAVGTVQVAGNVNVISSVGSYKIDGQTVIAGKQAGYGAPTGVARIANFAGGTATLAQTSAMLAQLIADLKAGRLPGA